MIICGIPENSICWANEYRWKNPFKCFTRKTFGGIFEEEFISCWGILFRRFREIQSITNSLSGFLEKKKSKCGVMPTRIASCMQVILGSIAKTFCSIHENSQTVLFFWKVTRPYSFVNNKLSSSARKQMLLLCFFNTISRWKLWTKPGKSAKYTTASLRVKGGLVSPWYIKRKKITLAKPENRC